MLHAQVMTFNIQHHLRGISAAFVPLLWVHAMGVAMGEPALTGPAVAEGFTGAPLKLSYSVQWQGAPGDYVVFPAEVTPPEGISARVAAVEARVDGDSVTVVQTLLLECAEPLTGQWPPVSVAWAPAEPVTAGNPPLRHVLEAPAVPLRIRDYDQVRQRYVGMGAAVILGLGAVGFLLLWRRSRRPSATDAGLTPAERQRMALHEARQHRLDGDFYGYYRALSGAAKLTSDTALIDRLAQRTRAVGYQGVKPVDDELDGDFKDVERAFARSREAVNP
jgi:hypothetical protein